jgi:preprotein translocase subunit YajC
MFIDPAFAQGTPAAGADPFTGLLIPMLLMVLIFYFLVIRPQSQRASQHKEMVEKVRRGDTVVTSGGMIGKVTKVSDGSDEVEVELSDTLRIRVLRSTLMDVRAKGEPVKETA